MSATISLKAGPSTHQSPRQFHDGAAVLAPGTLFVAGNILEGEAKVNRDNWLGMGYSPERDLVGASAPFPAPPVTTEPAQSAYEHVLQDAGATLPRRDAVDERIVREVRHKTGHIINWVKDAGGWPDFPAATSPSRK
jgi:large repetitive protein